MDVSQKNDGEHIGKMNYARQQPNQAIDPCYQPLQPPEKTPLETFEELGLVGCIDGEPDLSTNYKPLIHRHLQEKCEREKYERERNS